MSAAMCYCVEDLGICIFYKVYDDHAFSRETPERESLGSNVLLDCQRLSSMLSLLSQTLALPATLKCI